MATRASVTAPDVVWAPDEDEWVEDQAALALRCQLHQLVHALWRRLPAEVQAIIAGDLRRVEIISTGSGPEIAYGHDDDRIALFLPEEPATMHAAFEDWRPALSWVMVFGFGRAFLWSLLTRLVGANPVRDTISPHAEGRPGYAWLMTMAAGRFGDPAIQVLIDRMIEGLALAWGFGAELALEDSEDWGLAPDLRRIAQALGSGGASATDPSRGGVHHDDT